MVKRISIDKDWLYEQYVVNLRSANDIAKEVGYSDSSIYRFLVKYNIKSRTILESHVNHVFKIHPDQSYRDKSWLETKYIIDKKSSGEISEEIGCDQSVVCDWLKRFGIPIRSNSEAQKVLNSKPNCPLKNPITLSKISAAGRGKKRSQEFCDKRRGNLNVMNNPDVRRKQLESVRTEDHRKKMSIASKTTWENHPEYRKNMSDRHRGKKNLNYGRSPKIGSQWGKGSYYTMKDGSTVWLRSTYERRTAIILDFFGFDWLYEPKSFDVDEIGSWRPDIYLPYFNMWIEVKGYLQNKSRAKIVKFLELYQDEKLKIVFIEDIKYAEQCISNSGILDITLFGHLANCVLCEGDLC